MAIRNKKDAARVLGDVPANKAFFSHDGCTSRNLIEFESCLIHTTQEVFNYHVTPAKNDFCIWIRDVFGDHKLANDLARATNPVEAANIIAQRIAWLRKKAK
jgi:hypothetical protein